MTTGSRHYIRISILVAFLATLVVAGSVHELGQATPALAAGSIVHQVSVGGADNVWFWCTGPDEKLGTADDHPGCDGNFSLAAIQYADGTVEGQFSDQFAQGDGGVHATIDCLSVDGNEAWVSGVYTHGHAVFEDENGEEIVVDFTGLPFQTRMRDNGDSANDPADQIGFSVYGPGWAYSCTEHYVKKGPNKYIYALYNMPKGQVVVR